MSQLTLFIPHASVSTAEYQHPWYWEMAIKWKDTDKRAKDLYSPFQMKLWAWLKKKKALDQHPIFNYVLAYGQLKIGGAGMSTCPQKLISAYLYQTAKRTWWNFRHRSRGQIKWKNIDINLRIYFREHYAFNFSGCGTRPSDPHYLFVCWYCMEVTPEMMAEKRRKAA